MKVVLYNAVSLDGFIATLSGDSDWALDDEAFETFVSKVGCILIGRKTYEQYRGEIYPLNGVVNFVYSHHPENLELETTKELQFLGGSPEEILVKIENEGFESVMLGGGGEINASFAAAGLIDEMILDIHPLILGVGIKLLGSWEGQLNLRLLKSKPLNDGIVQNHYTIL